MASSKTQPSAEEAPVMSDPPQPAEVATVEASPPATVDGKAVVCEKLFPDKVPGYDRNLLSHPLVLNTQLKMIEARILGFQPDWLRYQRDIETIQSVAEASGSTEVGIAASEFHGAVQTIIDDIQTPTFPSAEDKSALTSAARNLRATCGLGWG